MSEEPRPNVAEKKVPNGRRFPGPAGHVGTNCGDPVFQTATWRRMHQEWNVDEYRKDYPNIYRISDFRDYLVQPLSPMAPPERIVRPIK